MPQPELPGIAPLPYSRGLDLVDDVGAVNAFGLQLDTLAGEILQHFSAALVDCTNIAQVKADLFPLLRVLPNSRFGPARRCRRTESHQL